MLYVLVPVLFIEDSLYYDTDCGDIEDIATNGGTNATETDCSFPCSGDPIHYCGGSDRLSLYTWTGEPLYVWDTPQNPGGYEVRELFSKLHTNVYNSE